MCKSKCFPVQFAVVLIERQQIGRCLRQEACRIRDSSSSRPRTGRFGAIGSRQTSPTALLRCDRRSSSTH